MLIDQITLLRILDTVGLFVFAWLIHLLPFLIVAVPVWFLARRRVKWSKWDFSIVIFPFVVWSVLMLTHDKGKGLGNFLEGLLIGCIASLAPIIRSIFKDKINQIYFAQGILIALCLIAIGIWAVIPATME
jgi:hypothetical protein